MIPDWLSQGDYISKDFRKDLYLPLKVFTSQTQELFCWFNLAGALRGAFHNIIIYLYILSIYLFVCISISDSRSYGINRECQPSASHIESLVIKVSSRGRDYCRDYCNKTWRSLASWV